MANPSVALPQDHAPVHWAIKLKAKVGKEAELESALGALCASLVGSTGAIGVHLFRSTTDAGGREFLIHRSFLTGNTVAVSTSRRCTVSIRRKPMT